MTQSQLSEFTGPGYFYVLSRPKPKYVTDFHEWYNSEHGPLRLKLDFFLNGYRYKSLGEDPPTYAACYDLKKISGLGEERYTILREKRSGREAELLQQKLEFLDRRIYSDVSSRGSNGRPSPVVMVVAFTVVNDFVDEVHRWYEQEHIEDISKIPGWRRTRRFKLVESDDQKEEFTELLAVHDFDQINGLDGPEHELAKSRPWRNRIMKLVERRENKRFEFLHEFDAAHYRKPPEPSCNTTSANNVTSTTSYQIDGCEDPAAPVIAFSNSLLTDFHIWDACIEELKIWYPRHRFLRYNTRGYGGPSKEKIDIDLLTDDLALLLDKLKIEKAFAVVGVSLGGITALNFAIKYPSRLERVIACDCNVSSSAANAQAWQDRIELAYSAGGWRKLADQTVKRWLAPASVEMNPAATKAIQDMILAASKDGFANCAGALCDFDISSKLKDITVPGLCVVGSKDGVLPETMSAFAKDIPEISFAEVPDTGHLPMVENAPAFVQTIKPMFELMLSG